MAFHFPFSSQITAMQKLAQRAMAKKHQQQQQQPHLISENAPENNEKRKFNFIYSICLSLFFINSLSLSLSGIENSIKHFLCDVFFVHCNFFSSCVDATSM